MIKKVNKWLNEYVFMKRGFGSLGSNCFIGRHSYYQNKHNMYIGNDTTIFSNARIQSLEAIVDKPPKITIGNHCYIGYYFTILAGADVTIENNVLIASHVIITSENHSVDPESNIPYMDQSLIVSPVVIKEGAWIGEKAIILPGVTVGKKSVIGGGSVVTKNVPDYTMVAGNPAKIIKQYNFDLHKWEKFK